MSRTGWTIVVCVAFVAALSAVQWLVTSPARITYGEVRLLVLAAIPALVATLSARWVDGGRREQ